MKTLSQQTRLIYNTKSLDYIKELEATSVCITTDPVMIQLGIIDPFINYFEKEGIHYEIFSDVVPNPTEELVQKGLLHIIKHKPDHVIAIGGGSAIDLAKAIIYYCISIKSEFMTADAIHRPTFIAIPTTSGTGSEVTNYTVITSEATGLKNVIQSDEIQPTVALLDYSLTLTAPDFITAETGFDALTHAMEAYVSTPHNVFSDAYAKEAVQLIFEHLIPSYADPKNHSAKENMQLASTMAGMAFNQSGLGLCHSIAHSLGSHFHLSHGKANALVLPTVMIFNAKDPQVLKRYSQIAKSLGFSLDSPLNNTRALVTALNHLKTKLKLPMTLTEVGITKEQMAELMPTLITDIKHDFCISGNPVQPTDAELENILYQLL